MQELIKSELEQVSGGCCFFSLFSCTQNKPSHACAPSHSCGSRPPVVVPPVVIPPTGGSSGGSSGG